MKPIEIRTERLRLVPLGFRFYDSVCEYATDPENTRYMIFLPESPAEAAQFLKDADAEWGKDSPEFYEFAVLYGDEHVGAVSVYFENGAGELGWILNKKYWGRGITTEAARAMVRYFAENMGTTHFIAHCDAENTASRRVMEKLGMTKTAEYGGRRNRAAAEDSTECQYELTIPK